MAVLLFGAAAVLFGTWEYLPPADRLAETLRDDNAAVTAGGYVGVFSAFFMIWFAGSLFRVLRERERGRGWLSVLALGGGVTGGVALAVGFATIIASAARAGTDAGISDIEAVALYDVYSQVLGQVFGLGVALLLAATAAVSLRTGLLPAWAAWVSVVIAIALVTPVAWIFLAAGVVWLVVASLWLYVRDPSASSPRADLGPDPTGAASRYSLERRPQSFGEDVEEDEPQEAVERRPAESRQHLVEGVLEGQDDRGRDEEDHDHHRQHEGYHGRVHDEAGPGRGPPLVRAESLETTRVSHPRLDRPPACHVPVPPVACLHTSSVRLRGERGIG